MYSTNPNSEIDPSGDFAVSMYPQGSFAYDTGDYGYDEAPQPEPAPVENQEVATASQTAQQPDPAAQNNTTGRQPDGSYVADLKSKEIAPLLDPNHKPSKSDVVGPNGECVDLTKKFSGMEKMTLALSMEGRIENRQRH